MLLENLSFLIVSPDLESRTKLREVLNAFVYKGVMKYERTLRNLVLQFVPTPESPKFDALFLASNFGREAIVQFIHEAKAKPEAKVPPIIIFINDKVLEKSSEVAALYLEGVDGFISEPYTSEQLLTLITTLKNQAKNGSTGGDKVRKAAEFLVSDAMAHIDELAKQQYNGEEPGGYALKNLKAVSKSLVKLSEQDLNGYGDILAAVFQRAKPAQESDLQRKVKKVQKRVVHPGATIREMMKARGLSAERLVPILRIDAAEFELLIKEQRGIDEGIAKELSRTLGMTSVEWMRLQREFDAKNQAKR